MSYWRTEYDDGWWTFYKDGIEIKFDNPNFGDLIVDEINNANLRIAELEAAQHWIPVSERLPEDLQSIIVFTKDRKTYIIRFLELYGREGFGSLSDIVTHWMPLPEPPIVYGKVCEE